MAPWGLDFRPVRRIADLVGALLERTGMPRLRLSSLEPWDLEPDFFSLWQDPRLCRHLHLPLQSGSDPVLKRMARKTTRDSFEALVRAARACIPGIAITTDLIAGFPGETDEEAAETIEFARSMDFAGGHVFGYSNRPGTPAQRLGDQVPGVTVRARSAALRAVLQQSAEAFHLRFVGKTMPVLWEAKSHPTSAGWQIEGLTDNYLRVSAIATEPYWNRIDEVFLKSACPGGLCGEILPRRDGWKPGHEN